MSDSRLAGFYKLSVPERIAVLQRTGWLSDADADKLRAGRQVLSATAADRVIENVVGVFGLPFAIAPNLRINERDYLVPMVVEEPSIVAAVSGAARMFRAGGGFRARCDETLLAGQVHVTAVGDTGAALKNLASEKAALLAAANAVHPRLAGRGGGVRDLEARTLEMPDGKPLICVHLLVDTVDAMGANLVNTICEAVAPRIADLCGGEVALRILSNLVDRSVVTVKTRVAAATLGGSDGAKIRDAIVRANDIARVDPHRAATHNKGIMNGIDALAIATGNDWRAIEAGAHAYAASGGRYQPLTTWARSDDGDLLGEIRIPLKVGTVGGTLAANPGAQLGLHVSGVRDARELAMLMATVGLAQNFAALRALVSGGIQQGHMKLHARSIAAAVNTPDDRFDELVARLVESGEIKRWKAEELLKEMQNPATEEREPNGAAAGKVILFGEHAVVYGRHALALPIKNAVRARVDPTDSATTLAIPAWDVSGPVDLGAPDGIGGALASIRRALGLATVEFSILVDARLPRGAGLGSSAAVAVAITRAMAKAMGVDAPDERINAIAFECEKLAHGTPSGVDNTLSTYGAPMLFRSADGLDMETLELPAPVPLLIACSDEIGLTGEQVAGVRERRARSAGRYDAVFDQMDSIAQDGRDLLRSGNYAELGLAMNVCHGLLNAIGVSTPELERMVSLARRAGASGAKLTGAGGGGSIVALCPETIEEVSEAMRLAGYRTLTLGP